MRSLLYIGLILTTSSFAQQNGVVLELGRDSIRIGEQTSLRLIVNDGNASIDWPLIQDTLSKYVEVVRDNGIDTVATDPNDTDSHVQLVRELIITSFDTGFWAIPPFRISVNGTAVETSPLLLHVKGVAVDATASLRDIHPVYPVPFHLGYWLQDNWYWFAGAAALALIVLLVSRMLKNRKHTSIPVAVAVELPMHERYLQELRELDGKRLWQQGAHKEYQSTLTDLLRGYIEERYKVPALERTTDELLHELKVSALDRDQQTQLANLLRLADMVKFAKALPAPAENEQMMTEAIRFVQQTAPSTEKTSKPVNA